ncbi:hypothetical protein WOLCODRAFT_39688, partial [Wolfiporia cocos MD-104 SS10]
MPPKSKWWKYFHEGSEKYRIDRFHSKAWCLSCLQHYARIKQDEELATVRSGSLQSVRSEAEIIREDEGCSLQQSYLEAMTYSLCSHGCQQGPSDLRQTEQDRLQRCRQRQESSFGHTLPAAKHQRVSDSSPFYGEAAPVVKWPNSKQEQFATDLCKLFIACNVAWWAVEHPFLRQFFATYIPAATLPGQKVLSGRILKEEAEKVLEDMRHEVNGKFATGQTDGWKNIAKSSLIGSIVNPWLLNIFNISATVKSAENLLALVISEIKYCTEVLHTVIVAWCTDASGESRKMRRLLQQKFPWIITVDCWAHQINLVVGDYFKLKSTVSHTMDDALEVAKWFNNHSRALGLLHDQQVTHYGGRALRLILPVITHWTAHYLTCTRLLELEKAIRTLVLEQHEVLIACVGDKRDARDKAQSIISIVVTESLWSNAVNCSLTCYLDMLQKHLEPLTIAANVLQADNAQLDTVLMTLGSLYGIFSQVEI